MDRSDIDIDETEEINEIDELLANMVRSNPCLYAKTNANYKNKDFVNNTWASIAASYNMSTEAVQKRWRVLRNQFTKEHRLQTAYEPSGTGNDNSKRPRKEWYLYQTIMFLVPHISHRKTSSNFTKNTETTNTGSASVEMPCTSRASVDTYQMEDDRHYNLLDLDSSSIDTSETPYAVADDIVCPLPDVSVRKRRKQMQKDQSAMRTLMDETRNTIEKVSLQLSSVEKEQEMPVTEEQQEIDLYARMLSCSLKKIKDMNERFTCYIECLTLIKGYIAKNN